MKRLAFYGCSAFVGVLPKGGNLVRFFGDDPDAPQFDPDKLIDLHIPFRTPFALGIARWDEVELDNINTLIGDEPDQDLALTTFGPTFPTGRLAGGVYLRAKQFDEARRANKLLFPPTHTPPGKPPDHPYQYKMVLYGDELTKRTTRYFGFRIKITDRRQSLVKLIAFQAASREERGPYWLDLSDVDMCSQNNEIEDQFDRDDPNDPASLPVQITASSTATEGAIFLSMKQANLMGLFIPKIPPTSGEGGSFPTGR